MKKTLVITALTAALTFIPASGALATTPPEDPNDVEAIDNPIDDNDEAGFDDWGLLGLIGLFGLAGLKRREPVRLVETDRDRIVTR